MRLSTNYILIQVWWVFTFVISICHCQVGLFRNIEADNTETNVVDQDRGVSTICN